MLDARSPANLILRTLTVILLLGWAWQLWRWTIPLEQFIQSYLPAISSESIHVFQQAWGLTLGLCGLIALGADWLHSRRLLTLSMGYASLSLFLIFVLIFRSKTYQWGNLIEHSIQWTLPLVFAFYRFEPHQLKSQWALRILIAATFFGHGLYAIGYYDVPASYLQMVHQIFGFDAASAERFLFAAGVLDMITVVGLLLPQLWRYVLYYAIVWGFLTAMARLVAYWDASIWLESLDIWLNQTLIRLGHGGLPLVLWLLERGKMANTQ
ncbi:MAG: hypothetical protein AB8H47_19895 [Bacteroidia bacterium]